MTAEHWRSTLRTSAVSLLAEASTPAGARVYDMRLAKIDLRKETLPLLAVYVTRDKLSRKSQASTWDAEATVTVAAYVKGVKSQNATAEENATAALDELCAAVEGVLLGDGVWQASASVKALSVETAITSVDAEQAVFLAEIQIGVELDVEIEPWANSAPLAKVTLTNDNSPADAGVTLPVDPNDIPEGVETYDEIEPEQET